MATFSAPADVSSIAGMIKYLCENTSLTDCSKISKKLSITVKNSKLLSKYTEMVKEHEKLTKNAVRGLDDVMEKNPEAGLDAMLDLQIGNVENIVKDYVLRTENIANKKETINEYLEQDAILNDLKKVQDQKDFEHIVQSLTAETDTSWWSCGISWLKRQFNWWWETIKGFANWLKDPKKLAIILFVLWLLLCEYNKYKESQRGEGQKCMYNAMAARAGQGAITGPVPYEPSTDILSTSCAKTEDMLNLLATYAQYAWKIIVNAFKSLFGLNTEYIVPTAVNPLANAEAWDYTISSALTEVSYTSGCAVAAAATGAAGSIGGVAASLFGIVAAPAVLVTGVVAGTLGLVCFAITRTVNTTVLKPVINQEYLALERTLLRPYLMMIWDTLFNKAIEMLNAEGTWAVKLKFWIDQCMGLTDLFVTVRLNLLSNIKNQYYANAMLAFKGMAGYNQWRDGNTGDKEHRVKNSELVAADVGANFMARMAIELPEIETEDEFDKLTPSKKLKILAVFQSLKQIDFVRQKLYMDNELDRIWGKNEDYIYNWYFPESVEVKTKRLPNLKF
jgi:hypothetical protein